MSSSSALSYYKYFKRSSVVFFFKLYATIKSIPNGYSLEIRNATVVLSLLSETSLQRLLKPQIITLIISCNYVKLNNLKLYL